MTTTLLNKEVAGLLDLSESGVSRLRSGSRHPSLTGMQSIEAAFGWTVQEQSDAIKDGTWTESFDRVLATHNKETDSEPEVTE